MSAFYSMSGRIIALYDIPSLQIALRLDCVSARALVLFRFGIRMVSYRRQRLVALQKSLLVLTSHSDLCVFLQSS